MASRPHRITRTGRQGLAVGIEQGAVNGPVLTTDIYEISIAHAVEPNLIDPRHIDHSAGAVVVDKVFITVTARGNLDILAIRSQGIGHAAGHLFRPGWRVHGF